MEVLNGQKGSVQPSASHECSPSGNLTLAVELSGPVLMTPDSKRDAVVDVVVPDASDVADDKLLVSS